MSPLCRNLFECIKTVYIGQTQRRGLFVIILLLLFYTCTGKYVNDNKFDYLIFSQRWLPTSCIEYVEKNNSSGNAHFCVLPKNFKVWSIHGLWPTKNKSMGPFFCNRSMPFDIRKIEPIESDLETYWPNIEGGQSISSLWQHEWKKHGTCAAQLESLNSEIKYFNTSLTLYKTHNMQVLLPGNKIYPSEKGINVPYLFYIIKNSYGKLPQIHCIHEVKTNRPYLSEIRLCYNKNLELIDCGNIHSSAFNSNLSLKNGLTNCPDNVILPDSSDPGLVFKAENKNSENLDYYNRLYDILTFIRFLHWASI